MERRSIIYACFIVLQTTLIWAVENFDPAKAKPWHNITCLGTNYDLTLPIIDGFNPNEVSMQRLCAKPQYDGGLPGQHLGGRCSFGAQKTVVFDLSEEAQVSTALQNPRTMLGCTYRCFCNYSPRRSRIWNQPVAGPPITVQPKGTYIRDHAGPGTRPSFELGIWQRPSYETYEVLVDEVDDFSGAGSMVSHVGQFYDMGVTIARYWVENRAGHNPAALNPSAGNPHQEEYVSSSPLNQVTCNPNAELPNWPLLPPYERWEFNNVQELCAMRMSGGHPSVYPNPYIYTCCLHLSIFFNDDTPRSSYFGANTVF